MDESEDEKEDVINNIVAVLRGWGLKDLEDLYHDISSPIEEPTVSLEETEPEKKEEAEAAEAAAEAEELEEAEPEKEDLKEDQL